ncbi:hypothetical protein [Mycolicibacterium diernhoferi]|uniref:Uncharacterized protein n=1 Tax=Mycolicibacterium diernhoferi TaxID=1801 RepID=A0A1Q4HKW3_9MYCO|nr:hypothetical protein [Mycolicibacterium diernhoferi]OJZ68178.1 hypothetical protein BRW64_00860 [Mycolicibacterium diernhoferi]OPE55755.1 hypothetical protein BV510_03420 [Mycolicibacterium diernhoferi]PEG56261.1 hypothetical protein CRI78_02530 [Mycolicibacterium diernhoferi]QYL25851.1 hypothetical protein K0O62_20220 [Mycolicibacterium diernhoferi]
MTKAERAFQAHLASTVSYFAAVEAAGDVPWFCDPAKLVKLGIMATEPMEARRELFMRRYR